ncbi:hypothetical protein HNQ07_003189 [Deinococcus metalli]|uniref:HNH endonuclease n=1 Tax=Deinococcus metalli TaxID=1141878 RepID=A0A7W8NRA0_9DEIO|nr:hypothetical protein [Deinococcus metalli]MBB5377690.1 hypothetical protein [Deinococcus metalli]GHF52579.1 hypothetical protein GCM10017781_31180 [Deinococcus metalli]
MTSRWLVFLVLGGSGALALTAGPPLLPDPALTPGDVLTTDAAVICRPGYSRTVRAVPQALKEQVYREYGITSRAPGEFEVDHLISLELGGSNSLRNLWPESYVTSPLNARVKDTLENRLHDLICAGTVGVPDAQRAIAHNWQEAYVKYVGPLPGGGKPQRAPNQPAIAPTHVPALPPGAADPEHPTLDLPILPGLPATSAPEPVSPDALPDTAPPTPEPPAATDSAPPSGPTPPDAQGACPADAPVKVSRSGVYHLPQGDVNYAVTRAVACFPDGPSAGAAGYRAAR